MSGSANRGFGKVLTTSPDYTDSPWANVDSMIDVLDGVLGFEVESADGAIGIKEGTAIITKGTAAALTLVAPTSGSPASGGDDGKILRIIGTTAAAHTVTTPSNAINGNKHIATFAAVGDSIRLVAYNAKWYAFGNSTTLS
jgi:hypothetical protein